MSYIVCLLKTLLFLFILIFREMQNKCDTQQMKLTFNSSGSNTSPRNSELKAVVRVSGISG